MRCCQPVKYKICRKNVATQFITSYATAIKEIEKSMKRRVTIMTAIVIDILYVESTFQEKWIKSKENQGIYLAERGIIA